MITHNGYCFTLILIVLCAWVWAQDSNNTPRNP
jgi:hypothetical protein